MRSISIWRGVRNLGPGLVVLTLFLPATARAHVAFDAPLAGDTLVAGETVSVAWTDVILHDPESFDLDLLLSEDGEAIPIAHGLSIDTHSYEWTVPDQPCTGCLLRVIQFNTFNYDYWEAIPITITSSAGSGGSGGTGGSAGEGNAGASGASDGGRDGAESGGGSGAPSNSGGTNSTGGSTATGGTAGSSGATGGSSSAGAPAAGAPAAGAPTAGAGAPSGDADAAADEGCSSSPGAPSPASPWLLSTLLFAATALLRTRSHRRRR